MSVVPIPHDPVAQYALLGGVGGLALLYGVEAAARWVRGKIQRGRKQRR